MDQHANIDSEPRCECCGLPESIATWTDAEIRAAGLERFLEENE